jgi:cell wall-associated NlpC family hydrolase
MRQHRAGWDRHRWHRRASAKLLSGALAAGISVVAVAPLSSTPTAVASATAEIDRQAPAVVREASEAMWRYRRYLRLRTTASLQHYSRARNQAARATAAALRLNPWAMVGAWAAADGRHQVATLAALVQLGVPYRRYGYHPSVGFDCSGLTSWAWRRAGVTIPRSSGDQIATAAPRRRATALPGDLVYYPGHVSLYLGVAGAIVHASDPQDDVELAFVNRPVQWGDPTR